jgi:hypothetical protein
MAVLAPCPWTSPVGDPYQPLSGRRPAARRVRHRRQHPDLMPHMPQIGTGGWLDLASELERAFLPAATARTVAASCRGTDRFLFLVAGR